MFGMQIGQMGQVGGFSWTRLIASMYQNGGQGAWYDLSDLSTLFQDNAMTLPVTASGQPIKKILDKSGNGNTLTIVGDGVYTVSKSGVPGVSVAGYGYGTTAAINLTAYSTATLFIDYEVDSTGGMCVAEFSPSTGTNNGAFSLFSGLSKTGAYAPNKAQLSVRASAQIATEIARPNLRSQLAATFDVGAATTGGKLSVIAEGVLQPNDINGTDVTTTTLGNYGMYLFARNTSVLRMSGTLHQFILCAGTVSYSNKYTVGQAMAKNGYGHAVSGVPVDLFVTAGQSNAVGMGTAASSPDVTFGTAWAIQGARFAPLDDPFAISAGSTGSAWPAFANKWKELTGRSTIWLPTAVGGSALIPAAGPTNWSQSGTLFAACVSAINAAVIAINAAPEFVLGNIYVVWSQGEQEGLNYNGTTITDTIYQSLQTELFTKLKESVPALSRVFISALGKRTAGVKDAEHALIRAAQAASAAELAYTNIVFTGAEAFVPAKMIDSVHYSQVGYNEMGEAMAVGAKALVYP